MRNLVLKSFILVGSLLSTSYGINNKEYLIDHGFIEKNQEDQSKEISAEFESLPKPTGPYQIGVKIYDIIDENRDNRLIPIWIYFPTKKGLQNLYPKISENRALDLFEVINLWNALEVNVHAKVIDSLNFLKNTGKHPVVVFNNGNGMLCSDAAFLLEDLASHGYIVISIQNQLNTDKLEPAKFNKGTFENYNKVIRNNLYVFDWLQKNNKEIFYGSLDLSRIGLIGYSMGGNSLLLWSDHASRRNHYLFPHEDSNAKECIVALDARRVTFPFINNTPIFMLISSEREEGQQINGEFELMKKIGHRFKYYKNTHHGSFSDHAYVNIECPLAPENGWYYGSTEDRVLFFNEMRKDIREFLEEKIGKYTNDEQNKWKIGGKIHFEEKSAPDYLGTIEINKLTKETLKEFFDFKIDSCDHNAKALIKKENDNYILSHYEERSSSGHGEEMHATLLYTSKRIDNGHETLKDVYQNLKNIDENLPSDRIPTVEEVAQAYNKIIKPDWKIEISDLTFVKGKTGSCIIAKLLYRKFP